MHRTRTRAVSAALALLVIGWGSIAVSAAEENDPKQQAEAAFAAQNWEGAIAAYTKVVEKNPSDGMSWFHLGVADRQVGKNAEALAAYQKAEAAGVVNVQLLTSAGICEILLGNKQEGFGYLERAAEKGLPPQVLKTHKDLASVQDDPGFEKIVSEAEKRRSPCENDPKYRAFDFWVGDWDVTSQGHLIGHNRIEKILGGCLLVENWTSATGVSGKSFNYLDPSTGKWKQNWVSEVGGVVRYEGEVKNGVMHYSGENVKADGTKSLARVTLEPMPDGRVHHLIEESTDGGKTWNVGFDAIYSRRKEGSSTGQ